MTNDQQDDEYKRATKAVVDDTMRIDVLGPYVVKVLKEHSPTGDQVKSMIVSAIDNDSKIQTALSKFHKHESITKKGQGLSNAQSIAVTAIISTLISAVVTLVITLTITNNLPKN